MNGRVSESTLIHTEPIRRLLLRCHKRVIDIDDACSVKGTGGRSSIKLLFEQTVNTVHRIENTDTHTHAQAGMHTYIHP